MIRFAGNAHTPECDASGRRRMGFQIQETNNETQ